MKYVFGLLLALVMAAPAHAVDVKIGEKNALHWNICFEEAAAVQVIDTAATAGLEESWKIWGLLVDGKVCAKLNVPIPLTVTKVVKSVEIAGEEYEPGIPLVLKVVELSDGEQNAWAITAEPVVP